MSAAGLLGQEMVRVPAGSFEVTDAITTVKVQVHVDPFLLGATEVTQADYASLTGSNPSFYTGNKRPVENVSWSDAVSYCNLRSAREKLRACYDTDGKRVEGCDGYRLPTEAEWMVAAGKPGSSKGHLGVASTKSVQVFEAPLAEGTLPVASMAANAAGLFDVWGNVWEWCEDFFSVRPSPDSVRNPRGPTAGVARVIRGGSFVSSTSRWSRDYRSSMNADARSRYTGFRVARNVADAAVAEPARSTQRFNTGPAGFESSTGWLAEVSPAALPDLRTKWERLLAAPKLPEGVPASRLVRRVEQRNFRGEIQELELEPGVWEKVYVLRPAPEWQGPRPVMVVPFYDIDTPAAADLSGRNYAADRGVNGFAYTAAQHGYIAVAVRWFGESYGEGYSEAVANLALRHPGATGLGKWVADARRVVNYVETLPGVDGARIGIMGHSLGGKMALYAGAFDPRIKAVVSSEPGIGFRFSNYEDYWYFGDKLASAPAGTDQHELLALTAPRPFLLIGGDEYDKAESWYYINAARPVYAASGKPENVGYLNHHTGHTPSAGAVAAAFEWLDSFLRP